MQPQYIVLGTPWSRGNSFQRGVTAADFATMRPAVAGVSYLVTNLHVNVTAMMAATTSIVTLTLLSVGGATWWEETLNVATSDTASGYISPATVCIDRTFGPVGITTTAGLELRCNQDVTVAGLVKLTYRISGYTLPSQYTAFLADGLSDY